ncbi:MAG: alkaline phytoceramidase [Acidobacteria bacterium]|nr:alkaline phytoceramidase [Acidobacteriota bacterium]
MGATYLYYWRGGLIAGIIILGTIVVVLHGPVSQDPVYHQFADQRTFLHIPNFWNVVSNIIFLAAAVTGIRALCSGKCPGVIPALRHAYGVFFIGSGLIAFGSAYYHLSPNNMTLIWDRYAMTIAFMAFMAIITGEHMHPRFGRLLLLPLLALGLLSVLVWKITDTGGQGDLRFYILIQYLPFILIPLIVILYPSRLNKVYFIWCILAAYAVGKAFELLDTPIFDALHISGHTLKHLMAALGMFSLILAIKKRDRRDSHQCPPI